jgi:hypothetical protein
VQSSISTQPLHLLWWELSLSGDHNTQGTMCCPSLHKCIMDNPHPSSSAPSSSYPFIPHFHILIYSHHQYHCIQFYSNLFSPSSIMDLYMFSSQTHSYIYIYTCSPATHTHTRARAHTHTHTHTHTYIYIYIYIYICLPLIIPSPSPIVIWTATSWQYFPFQLSLMVIPPLHSPF